MNQPTPFHHVNHRDTLLSRRALLEDGYSSARTVGDVWRLNQQLGAVEQLLAGEPAVQEPAPLPTPLDDDTLAALRIAVGLLPGHEGNDHGIR